MLLIFDWDGTLSNSTPKIVHCIQQAAISTGFPVLEPETILNIIGLGLPEAMHCLYPSLSDAEREQIRLSYIEHFLDNDKEPSPFFDGVIEGLERLFNAGFTMAVATSKSRRGLERILDVTQTRRFFTASRCADETASKPHPLMLHELLTELGVSKEQAIMVGDTEYDMDMARQANVGRVAVSYGAHHIDRMRSYEPVLTVDHFSEFTNWVLSRVKHP